MLANRFRPEPGASGFNPYDMKTTHVVFHTWHVCIIMCVTCFMWGWLLHDTAGLANQYNTVDSGTINIVIVYQLISDSSCLLKPRGQEIPLCLFQGFLFFFFMFFTKIAKQIFSLSRKVFPRLNIQWTFKIKCNSKCKMHNAPLPNSDCGDLGLISRNTFYFPLAGKSERRLQIQLKFNY